ncbi:MAG: histidine--tRNA ligase [Lachnospiraceae bacterium]|nr:histidine--tRNA ligase [Lachnospiraceae bacterium]
MTLKKTPANGMKDVMPSEMEIRDYLVSVIKKTYAEFGFQSIETPCVENIENLMSKQGGENEKLIFKILKRGEKLNLEEAKSENDLVDLGLRYDLTVPLVRFFSNHENELPTPFKTLQMGNVWRADRPQKGRYRQFMQCDIDIIGEPSNLAEIELILATTTTLGRIGFENFQIRINERRLLKAMARYSGFAEESFDEVFVILDKMDKIGLDGVRKELMKEDFAVEAIDRYISLFEGLKDASDPLAYLEETLRGSIEEDVIPNLRETIDMVEQTKTAKFDMVFDPTIVRGMSYYTGTIFEISMPQLGISCGGGGRYDNMVGRFTGRDVPACGFSIGFERILLILMEQHFQIPGRSEMVAYLLEKDLPAQRLSMALSDARKEREDGKHVLIVRMNKNKKFQKQQLSEHGYTRFVEFYAHPITED